MNDLKRQWYLKLFLEPEKIIGKALLPTFRFNKKPREPIPRHQKIDFMLLFVTHIKEIKLAEP